MDISRRALRTFGLGLVGLAAVLGLVALQHMRAVAALGFICGGAVPHCPACPASVAALLGGVSLLVLSARAPRRRRIRIDD